jgi:hypothetical protein
MLNDHWLNYMSEPTEQAIKRYEAAIKGLEEFVAGCRLETGDDPLHNQIVAPHNDGVFTVLSCLTDPQDNGPVRKVLDEFAESEVTRLRTSLEALRPQLLYVMRAFGCPCGARPESLATHPHVIGCGFELALIALTPATPEPATGSATDGARKSKKD